MFLLLDYTSFVTHGVSPERAVLKRDIGEYRTRGDGDRSRLFNYPPFAQSSLAIVAMVKRRFDALNAAITRGVSTRYVIDISAHLYDIALGTRRSFWQQGAAVLCARLASRLGRMASCKRVR